MSKLDSKSCAKKVETATRLAVQALERHGEPTMTLTELRALLGQQLKGVSLTDLIIQERHAGW